jgi:hypothetical protein
MSSGSSEHKVRQRIEEGITATRAMVKTMDGDRRSLKDDVKEKSVAAYEECIR